MQIEAPILTKYACNSKNIYIYIYWWRAGTYERPGTDHVTVGPMRGLKINYMKRGQINIYTDLVTI